MKALEKILLYKEEKIEFEDYFDITKKWVKVLLYTQKKQVFFITFYDITKYKVKEIEIEKYN